MENKNRATYYLIGVIAVVFAFMIGLVMGEGRSPAAMANKNLTDIEKVSKEDFNAFWKAWQILDDKFVGATSTTAKEKVWGSIQGLASSYKDPYTVFFPPVESKMFQEDISGDFEGVGMEIGIKNKQLQVITPLKNSPAEKAGVKTGDIIIKINDSNALSLTVDQAVKLIRGPKGSVVKITFLPQGATKTVERNITRAVINIPTIETSTKPGGIFVIRLYSFTAQSPDLFRNALRKFVLSDNKKLIVDLRGNPGGYLEAAWDIASWFLPAGKVVITEDFGKNGSPKVYYSKGYNAFDSKLKMMILVDGGSASASEILAGALHEHGVAKLVGTKTFGKGSVQELIPVTPETSIKVTIARWLTPEGHNLSENGLDPDYMVEVTEQNTAGGKDPILEKAIELLNK